MISKKLDATALFAAFNDTAAVLVELISSFDSKELNMVAITDSWTPGQVVEHLSKSNEIIAEALKAVTPAVDRQGDERIRELHGTFLDFSLKFKAAPNLAPTEKEYRKEPLLARLQQSIDDFTAGGKKATLQESIVVPGFGELTKFELLYLVLYHTQRHIEQLKNIHEAIYAREVS